MTTVSFVLGFLLAHANVLSVDPPRIAPKPINDTFRVKINIGDAAHLYGYNISLAYDSLVLQAVQVSQGPFLRRFGSTIWGAGTIKPGLAMNAFEGLFTPAHAGFGSGTLLSVKFRVIGPGSTRIRFTPISGTDSLVYNPCALADYFGAALPIFTILDGWYGTQGAGYDGTFNVTPGAANGQEQPAGTWFAPVSRYVIAWQDRRNGADYNIWSAQVSPDGTVGTASVVCDSAGDQVEPAIAYNPAGGFFSYALGTWTDYRRGADSADIYGRLFYSGSPAGAGFPIAAYPGFQNNPQIARCGSKYLVVWNDLVSRDSASHAFGRIITYQGSPAGAPVQISPSTGDYCYHFNPAAAASDSAYLIVWSRSYAGYCDLTGRLMDSLGNLGSLIAVDNQSPANVFYQPACSFDGSNYLVIWNELDISYNSCPQANLIRGRFVSRSGAPGSSFSVYQTQSIYDFVQGPMVGFDGENYLVTWDEKTAAGIDFIKGCFVTPAGSAGAPFIIAGAPYRQAFPASVQGSSSIVVWQDFRNGTDSDVWGYLGDPIGIGNDTGPGRPATGAPGLAVYPNPAAGKAVISFRAGTGPEPTGLAIYDAAGRAVKSFGPSVVRSPDRIVWSGRDDAGRPVESGVYFARGGGRSVKFLFLK